ncbi:MAG: glycosyltransferase family 1 protein [Candidatus Peregrinibacteria bacterium]|nr:glycosyltransferase family 1 protein [Candidatus Peregrinibacteria bacterium]
MHLAIDVREACRSKRTGKGQWSYGFVTELLTRHCTVTLFTDQEIPRAWESSPQLADVRTWRGGFPWHFSSMRELQRSKDIDLYVSPTSYIVPSLIGSRFPCVPIVHDLIAFQGEPHDAFARRVEKFTLKRAAEKCAVLCTISAATERDLLERYPSLSLKLRSILYAGPMRSEPLPRNPDGKTILCVGTLCPRKNQLRLIEAYAALPPALRSRTTLILAGARGWDDEQIVERACTTPGVEWRKYIPNEEYQFLLSTCEIFALPSLYEGFGMQVLDALQAGIPTLVSDRGSLPEVTADAALRVDPLSVDAIAGGLHALLTDGTLRRSLQEKAMRRALEFRWERTVDLFLTAVRQWASIQSPRKEP